MAGAHAFLAPSAVDRWKVCALSASLEAAYPDDSDSPASLDGQAAHWVVQMVLEGRPPVLTTLAPNGIAVTAEMLEGAELVIRAIESRLGANWRRMLVIERTISIPRIHPTQCWGTPDYYAWAMLPDGRRILFVFDYKFGQRIVDVFENGQLTAYSSGLMSEIPGLDDRNTIVVMCIIQPRAFHRDGTVRWWQVVASDLRADLNIMAMQAEKATRPNPEARPDPDACENCSGRHACEAFQRKGYSLMERAQQVLPLELSPHAIGLELRALKAAEKLLKARVSGLEEQAVALLKRGQHVPFWMMDSVPGRLTWTRSPQEVIALGEMMGVRVIKEREVITPTQAIDAGISAELIASYASRPVGAVKLTYDDGSKARLTFGSSVT